jgi:short-subunit dehydrogenase
MFTGKRIFITGASSGIGKALAEALAPYGPRLVLLSRRLPILEALASRLPQQGATDATGIACDVRSFTEIQSAVKRIQEQWGGIDIAILAAGVSWITNLTKFDLDRIRETLETNTLGIVNSVGALLPVLRAQGGGLIVGISSLADHRGVPDHAAYCASKAAVTVFLEGMRVGLRREGIRVVTVKPGFVRTPLTAKNRFPMPFLMEPEEAARIILKGIKKDWRVIQFPGPLVGLTGILNHLPNALYDRLLQRSGTVLKGSVE